MSKDWDVHFTAHFVLRVRDASTEHQAREIAQEIFSVRDADCENVDIDYVEEVT